MLTSLNLDEMDTFPLHLTFLLKKGTIKQKTLKANTAKRPHLLDLVDRYVGVGHVSLMLEKLN